MPQSATVWTESFPVRSYEVTPRGHASIQTIGHYLQEVASNHAQALGFSRDQMLAQNTAWVLSRLRVAMDRYPPWRSNVRVETWPSSAEGLRATREFILTDDAGEPLGRATSAWFVIDIDRRRPTRLPDSLDEVTPPDRERPLPLPDENLPAPDQTDHEHRFRVRYSDLDLNAHVNNMRYVEWAVEAVPKSILDSHQLAELDIQFRAETTFGETIETQAQQVDSSETPSFLHIVRRRGDEQIVAQARTVWQE